MTGWIRTTTDSQDSIICPKCNDYWVMGTYYKYPWQTLHLYYCPNCGAQLYSKEDELSEC